MVVVLSYWDVSDPSFGGGRRVDALLRACGREAVLVQPRRYHPSVPTVPFPVDLGRRKVGINWGIFNFKVPRNARIARSVIRAQTPQLVVMTSIWNLPPVPPGVPTVLDTHDVNAVAIGERFGEGHPFTRLVRAQERLAMERADHVFTCSDLDRQQLISLYGINPQNVTSVPNGVDASKFGATTAPPADDPLWQRHLAGHFVLFFMGKLDYQPNRAAIEFLAGTLMPELDRRAPGRFKLLITGGPVPQQTFPPSMVFAGRVPDERLTRYLQSADLCLAPVFSGSGTRLKVLEYLAAGRHVVSTPKGAEGIEDLPPEAVSLCPAEDFASRILALSEDRPRLDSAGLTARRFVQERYDWSNAALPKWRDVLRRWVLFPPNEGPGSNKSL